MPNSITKLFPQSTTIKLDKLDHVFTVNRFTLKVDAWIKDTFGSSEEAGTLLQSGYPEAIMKLFYNLLSFNDKVFLKSVIVESDMDEDGNIIHVTNQLQKLLHICTVNDIEGIFIALMKSRGMSLPEGFGEDEKGKKPLKVKKK